MSLDPIRLDELLARESEQVEWKEGVADERDVVRTLVAFGNDLPNLGGGRVVCGAREVKDPFGFPSVEIVGLDAARLKAIEGKVLALCRDRVAPSLAPTVTELPSPDPARRVLVFTVLATGRAHSFDDGHNTRHYVRIGRETRVAQNGVLLRLLSMKGEMEPWDRRPTPGATVADLDLIALRDGLTRLGLWSQDAPIERWLDPNVTLSAFAPSLCVREPLSGVVRPRNFAMLLFGRAIQRFIPGAVARLSLYPGLDRAEPHSERLDLDGTVLQQAERLIQRLNLEAVITHDKSSGLPQNNLKYPHIALKEAVVNALAHRDYQEPHPTRVTVFADRVEVWSPGGLDSRVASESFVAGRASAVWRNQALAWFFSRLDLAQAEGQGIPSIIRSMRAEGCPDPSFELTEGSVLCVLPAHPRHARTRDLLRVEREMALGHIPEATATLERLLHDDPFNYRTLALLAEIVRSTGDPSAALRLLRREATRLDQLPAQAQLSLADALISTARDGSIDDPEVRALVGALLARASSARMELGELRRYVLAQLFLKDERAAMDALRQAILDHPEWEREAVVRQLRGRAWLLHAQRCHETLKRGGLTPRLADRAREDNREYLRLAERDLTAALELGATGAVRDHAEAGLSFLRSLAPRAPRRGR